MKPHLTLALVLSAVAVPPLVAQSSSQHPPGGPSGQAGRHGNPADLASYVAHLADPRRDAWQKPDEVVRALGLAPGQTACDIGAGPGYFSLRLAAAVGPRGRVYAVDVEAQILAALQERLTQSGARNVTPVLSVADDPLLPEASCDVVLVVDTYHHFPDPPAYLKRLASLLRPGGRVVNIDYHKRPTPVGPPLEHRVAREEFLKDAAGAGLRLVAEPTFLEHQYFLVLQPGN